MTALRQIYSRQFYGWLGLIALAFVIGLPLGEAYLESLIRGSQPTETLDRSGDALITFAVAGFFLWVFLSLPIFWRMKNGESVNLPLDCANFILPTAILLVWSFVPPSPVVLSEFEVILYEVWVWSVGSVFLIALGDLVYGIVLYLSRRIQKTTLV